MSIDKGIWLDGEKELFVNMQRVMRSNLEAAREGLQAGAMDIINEAKQNLRNNGSISTGQLRASGKVQTVQNDPDAVDAGFFSDDTRGGYAYFVENGRRSGKMPPVDYLIQWFRKKFGMDEKEARASGWATARTIARKGTTPHPFFAPAVEKHRKSIEKAIKQAIAKDISNGNK